MRALQSNDKRARRGACWPVLYRYPEPCLGHRHFCNGDEAIAMAFLDIALEFPNPRNLG